MIVWSRSGLVDTMWMGTPVACSIRCRYRRALTGSLPGKAYLVGVRYGDGRRGQMLAVVGGAPNDKVARAVTEALAFSGIAAGTLDVTFLAADDPALARMAGLALVFEGQMPPGADVAAPVGPGMDRARPPILC